MTQDFGHINATYRKELLQSEPVDVGEWHAMPTNGIPQLVTMEVVFADFSYRVPKYTDVLALEVRPNNPWAEEHFQERVSGWPMNPAPSHVRWPWAHSQHHDENEKFSHTYPERFWPKQAGYDEIPEQGLSKDKFHRHGIRYAWGDLMDVAKLLKKNKYTRQAVLPVFFPEDTGNQAGVRIPCSLTYQFLVRGDEMHMFYHMRSCDFVRHFRDDVYMACRLLQWMCEQVQQGVVPGRLHMTIGSLHAMEGDRWKMTEEEKEDGQR